MGFVREIEPVRQRIVFEVLLRPCDVEKVDVVAQRISAERKVLLRVETSGRLR